MRFHQPVQMDNDIFHFRIIHRALGMAAPGFFRFGIAGKNSDYMHLGRIDEFERLRVRDPSAHHEVQELLRHCVSGFRS